MSKPRHYTLVQHSGHRHDPGFVQAVEEVEVRTTAELQRVRRAGGVLFSHYGAATRAEYAENYPADVRGLYPRAHGCFATDTIRGLRIYIPATKEQLCHDTP